jgi:CRISPR-associated protein Csb1
MTTAFDIYHLKKLVDGGAVAIRGKATLQPAGGSGDKVFPPTHSRSDDELRRLKGDERAGAKYAFEERRLPGGVIERCVLLDSVQSQANRMEEALQALWANKKIALPVIAVSFTEIAPEVGIVTSLSAPHRIADALLRDSLCDGMLFRLSELGKSFTDASSRNAGALFRVCPTALVFGMWDSTGPKGGLGAKFERALVSEIVGVGAVCGVKTSSRIDPAGIMKDSATIFVAKERDAEMNLTWTTEVLEAEALDAKNPPTKQDDIALAKKWGKKEKAGKPSAIVHGNIAPSIDDVAGGVTVDHAEHTVVLSMAALRRLSFGTGESGAEEDSAARTLLAALALLAVLAAEAQGHDLRSRCLLVPQRDENTNGALKFESIAKDGTPTSFVLTLADAITLYMAAVASLPASLQFKKSDASGPLEAGETLAELMPSEKLKHLVRESRRLAAAGADVQEA